MVVVLGLPWSALKKFSFREIGFCGAAYRSRQRRSDSQTARLTAIAAAALGVKDLTAEMIEVDPVQRIYTEEEVARNSKFVAERIRREVGANWNKMQNQAKRGNIAPRPRVVDK